MRPPLALLFLAGVGASQVPAADSHRHRPFLAQTHSTEVVSPHSSSVLDRGGKHASLELAAELAAVQLSTAHVGREPARRIDPAEAEDQYAENNQPQVQAVREEEPEQPQEAEEHPEETLNGMFWHWWGVFRKHFWSVFFTMVLQMLLITLIAILYKHKLMIRGEVDTYARDDFSSSLFACHEDLPICFWSCCCPAIRWGDTIGKMQWMGFWSAFFLFLLMMLLVQVFSLMGLSMFIWIAFSVLLAHYRGRLRRDLSFAKESAFCLDTLVFACCQCCAIAQEARHVKSILKAEYS